MGRGTGTSMDVLSLAGIRTIGKGAEQLAPTTGEIDVFRTGVPGLSATGESNRSGTSHRRLPSFSVGPSPQALHSTAAASVKVLLTPRRIQTCDVARSLPTCASSSDASN
jgi:hypothetical protein